MPWNSPKGGRDDDPWGQKSNQQGPPDLDEVFRNLGKKFGGIFGSRGSRGSRGSGGSKRPYGWFVLIAAIALWGIYDKFGIYTVQQAERGVELRFGQYVRTTTAGLNWHIPFPIETVEIVNIDEVREVNNKTSMLTQDENIVEVSLEAQYKIKSAEDYLFNLRDPDLTVKDAMESAVREVVGKSTIDFVLFEGRGQISSVTRELLQGIMDEYKAGIYIQKVNLEKSLPPDQVKAAFSDAIKSREDYDRYIKEAEAYANSIVPQARGEAARFLQEANAYRDRVVANSDGEAKRFLKLLAEYEKAPDVTRERLYLDAVESVYANSNKLLMDVEGGNNLIYLPLDQLIKQRALTESTSVQDRFSTDNGQGNQQGGLTRPGRGRGER
ncbi:MAG: FtsH protease activity modulator HflK [Gammaproteobacteria bacterium]|nr:FtsH protease activity modulator HflK [Gammaproteobacteria bacterium]